VTLRLRAIRPREFPLATDNMLALIDEELGRRGFAGGVIEDLANYPAALPWKGPTPKSGPRKDGRRTGTLGRNWRIVRLERTRARRSVEVANQTPYAVYVEGPPRGGQGQRQTANMRERGWPNITAVARKRWAEHQPIIVRILAQRDPRLRRRPMPR